MATTADCGSTFNNWASVLRSVDDVDPSSANFVRSINGKLISIGYHWNTSSLAYEVNTGGTSSGSDVNVTNFPTTQAVSLATAPSTPVTGTFWQSTQPVSGTFWQSTQPVSLATAPSTPVTGTFWQSTQPVSGTFWQSTQPVSGTFWQATQPVSAASLPLPPDASTETTLAKLALAQAASGASTSGPMVQALVDDAPPTYIAGNIQPLSLTNEGRLRVSAAAALDNIRFFEDDFPVYAGSPSYISSPWASPSAVW